MTTNLPTTYQLKLEGYLPVTYAYMPEEEELFQKAVRDMRGTDFRVGSLGAGRVICRRKGEVK